VKNKKKKKIHKDKHGREYIKETYFVGGKMKFHRIYVIDGIPADEFYEKNATDLDFYLNGDYELMSSEKVRINHFNEQSKNEIELPDDKDKDDLPF
jgi:putative NIF3 family GTP cyclohydrolase 1 type 2